ncbi:Amino_acid transporter family protein [Hexamita inflata]|uniref:Amino acid transporter family protein n=1 Tax=Hexamita inflata TaxID=28002 RepID=A0AA86UI87_9EUKA|nr:Amino acid transporter family protein [Hexamita inflata]
MMSNKKQILKATVIMLSQMFGACMLQTPYIFARMGWVLSIVVFAFTVGFDVFMYRYFIEVSHYTKAQSYRELTEKVVSKKLSIVLEVSIVVSYFGFITAYIIISSSSVMTFLDNVFDYQANKYVVKAIIAFCIILPICMLKSLKQLSKVGAVSNIAVITFALSVIVYFFIHVGSGTLCSVDSTKEIKYGLKAFPSVSPSTIFLYVIMYIPSLQGNFTAQTVIPTMLRELQGTPAQRKKIAHTAIWIAVMFALLLYLMVGFMGAAMFGEDITDNLFTAFAPCKWIWIDILSLIYAGVVILAYPIVLYPIKISIVGWCKKDPHTKAGYKIQVITTLVFVVLNTALAMVLESIVVILGLFSSLTGVILYFVIPVCFIVQYPKIKKENLYMDHVQEDTEDAGTATQVITVANITPTLSQNDKDINEDKIQNQIVEQNITTVCEQKQVEDLQQSIEVKQTQIQLHEVTKSRKVCGVISIILFVLICSVGIYMNGADFVAACS